MLSFAQPLFLWAFAALAAPVLLHLLRRQVAVNVTFPSIRYILRGRLPKSGRRRLRDVLLLLLRLLLFTVAVLTFARPLWQRDLGQPGAAVARNGAVILVDASASMAGWGGMDEARQRVTALLLEQPDRPFGIVVSSRGRQTTLPVGTDRGRIEELVAGLAAEPVRGDHVKALAWAVDALAAEDVDTLYVVSDFQTTDWSQGTLPIVPVGKRLELVDVSMGRLANVGIVGADVLALPGGGARVNCEIRNYGPTDATRKVILRAGDTEIARDVRVPAKRDATATIVVDNVGTKQGDLRLSEDEYGLDDHYAVWLGGEPSIRLLAVVPFEAEPEKSNELYFLRKALSVPAGPGMRTFEVEEVDAEFFFALDTGSVEGVLLLGAAGYLRDEGFEKLKEFVDGGGTVLCTPGKAAGQQFMGLARHGLLSTEFGGITGEGSGYGERPGLAWVNPDGALGQVFSDPNDTDLFLFPIYRYARLTARHGCTVLLRTDDDAPALVQQDVGNGRVYASAVAFDPTWSDLPVTTSFLPLIRELFAGPNIGSERAVGQLECGEPVPRLKSLLGEDAAAPEDDVDTGEPRVIVVGDRPFEVNVSRHESVPDQRPLLAVREQLQTGDETPITATPAERERMETVQLWPWCASALALLLLGELLLATMMDISETRVRVA